MIVDHGVICLSRIEHISRTERNGRVPTRRSVEINRQLGATLFARPFPNSLNSIYDIIACVRRNQRAGYMLASSKFVGLPAVAPHPLRASIKYLSTSPP
jgi:hypothetical protein